jgi:hypothetical protein
MTIKKFRFRDALRKWTLNETSFGDFNLLVGVSGVGKTRILKALDSVRNAGLSNAEKVNGCEWTLELVSEQQTYVWSARVSLVPKDPVLSIEENSNGGKTGETGDAPRFVYESIVKNGTEVLVKRTQEDFSFLGKPLPKLKQTESAITLLRDETSVAPLYSSLTRFYYSEAFGGILGLIEAPPSLLEQAREKCADLRSLKDSKLPLIVKAYILQEDYTSEFEFTKQQYMDIFPTVSDIRIGKLADFGSTALGDEFDGLPAYFANNFFTIGVKEHGLDDWVTRERLSSGMLRTIVHLIELALAPDGTVVIIDEIENSLGVNCLPQLSEHFLERSRDLQFIITSHHPYIINAVPVERWRVVTREGSVVTVRDQASISGLQTLSAQDSFTLLTNLPEYQEGVR